MAFEQQCWSLHPGAKLPVDFVPVETVKAKELFVRLCNCLMKGDNVGVGGGSHFIFVLLIELNLLRIVRETHKCLLF